MGEAPKARPTHPPQLPTETSGSVGVVRGIRRSHGSRPAVRQCSMARPAWMVLTSVGAQTTTVGENATPLPVGSTMCKMRGGHKLEGAPPPFIRLVVRALVRMGGRGARESHGISLGSARPVRWSSSKSLSDRESPCSVCPGALNFGPPILSLSFGPQELQLGPRPLLRNLSIEKKLGVLFG